MRKIQLSVHGWWALIAGSILLSMIALPISSYTQYGIGMNQKVIEIIVNSNLPNHVSPLEPAIDSYLREAKVDLIDNQISIKLDGQADLAGKTILFDVSSVGNLVYRKNKLFYTASKTKVENITYTDFQLQKSKKDFAVASIKSGAELFFRIYPVTKLDGITGKIIKASIETAEVKNGKINIGMSIWQLTPMVIFWSLNLLVSLALGIALYKKPRWIESLILSPY